MSTVLTLLAVFVIALAVYTIRQLAALRRELQAVRKAAMFKRSMPDTTAIWEDCAESLRQLSLELDAIRGRLDTNERTLHSAMPVWPSESSSIQLNRRGQILRLSGKGKSTSEIASDLGISQGEVELLLKVHDLAQAFPRTEV